MHREREAIYVHIRELSIKPICPVDFSIDIEQNPQRQKNHDKWRDLCVRTNISIEIEVQHVLISMVLCIDYRIARAHTNLIL